MKGTAERLGVPMESAAGEPLDATVIAVWGDRLVNLAIFDIYGTLHARRSVTLVQDEDTRPIGGRFAEWMPYQVATAKADSVPASEDGHDALSA